MFDLHVHTKASDGELDAKGIIDEAKKVGVTKIAITDHDTLGNVRNCIEEGKKNGILVIPGIELNVNVDHGEMHILGYGFDINNKKFNQAIQVVAESRKNRNKEIIRILNTDFGIDIDLEDAEKFAKGDVLARPHFALALIEKGIVSTVREAFDKYLATPQIEDIKMKTLKPDGAIDLINQANGIAVLAHPFSLKLNDEETYEKIKLLKSYGLAGVEAYHSEHSKEQAEKYRKMAENEGLIITCGSDFHGASIKPEIKLGSGINCNLPTSDELIFKRFYSKICEKSVEVEF